MDKQDLVLEIGKVGDQGFEINGRLFDRAKQLIKELVVLHGSLELDLWLSFVDGRSEGFCIQKIYLDASGDVAISGHYEDGDMTQYDLYSLPDGGIFYLCDEIYEKYIKE